MQAKPEQRGRQEAESWPRLLGSQHCNRVKNHVVAKPETVGEAQIVGKSHTAVLYILNTKCLINLSAMPEPNLFKLSSALLLFPPSQGEYFVCPCLCVFQGTDTALLLSSMGRQVKIWLPLYEHELSASF